MLEKVYFKIINDVETKKIYTEIELKEKKEKARAYHNINHIFSVLNIIEKISNLLNIDNDTLLKTKIACLLHDTGIVEGKGNHAYRSYEFAIKYFQKNFLDFDGKEEILNAIKNHSDGFDSDSLVTLLLIFGDKLDIKKDRISKEGRKIEGNRQYFHINDIVYEVNNDIFVVKFITDSKLDFQEMEEYYFTKKVLMAINSLCKKMNMRYMIYIDNELWVNSYI